MKITIISHPTSPIIILTASEDVIKQAKDAVPDAEVKEHDFASVPTLLLNVGFQFADDTN